MKGLMLHCGGQLRSREEVFAVPVPPATASYVPLPYESLITRIEKQVAAEINLLRRKAVSYRGQAGFGPANAFAIERVIRQILAVEFAVSGFIKSQGGRAKGR